MQPHTSAFLLLSLPLFLYLLICFCLLNVISALRSEPSPSKGQFWWVTRIRVLRNGKYSRISKVFNGLGGEKQGKTRARPQQCQIESSQEKAAWFGQYTLCVPESAQAAPLSLGLHPKPHLPSQAHRHPWPYICTCSRDKSAFAKEQECGFYSD